MTALERALVVYAEAKGHEVEYLHKDNIQWNIKDTAGFNFEHFKYRIMNKKDYRKVYDELSDFFKPLYAPEQPSKLLSDMERVKYKPAGFSCKTKMYTREEIEKMNKAKEVKPEAIPATEDELEIIGKGVLWCRNKKVPNRMGWIRHSDKLNKSEWYLFDEQTKTWQDWGEK